MAKKNKEINGLLDMDGKKRDIEYSSEVNKYVLNKMKRFHNSKYVQPSINSGHVSPQKLERGMYMNMGKLNRTNKDKITSNTHIQNPTQMTARFLFNKNFDDLDYD